MKKLLTLTLNLAICLSLSACLPQSKAGENHGHGSDHHEHENEHGHGGDHHGHENEHSGDHEEEGHPANEAIAVTIWRAKSELFLEYKPFVVGRGSKLLAHISKMNDFKPVTEGTLKAILTNASGEKHEVVVDAPARAGIFTPVITMKQGGTYQMSLELTSKQLNDTIPVGEVTVYASTHDVPAPQEEVEELISFLKEQQWKINFATDLVKYASLPVGVKVSGVIETKPNTQGVLSSPISGHFSASARIPITGDYVRKGQLIGYVAPPLNVSESDRVGLDLSLEQAQSQRNYAHHELRRLEALFQEDAIPFKRVESARHQLTLSEQRFEAAQRKLQRFNTLRHSGGVNLSERSYPLRIPISGVVTSSNLVSGSQINQGRPLLNIINTQSVWIKANVFESDIPEVRDSSKIHFSISGYDAIYGHNSRLKTVGKILDSQSKTLPVYYEVPNSSGVLKVGMNISGTIPTGESKKGAVVPLSAIVDNQGKSLAYVHIGGEEFDQRELKLGAKHNQQVQVLEGLKPGERVVTKGGYEIRLSTLSNTIPAHGHAH